MAIIDRAALEAEVNAKITTNGMNAIKGSDLRGLIIDIVMSALNLIDDNRGNPILNLGYQNLTFAPDFPLCTQQIVYNNNYLTSIPSVAGLMSLNRLDVGTNLLDQAAVDAVLVDLLNLLAGSGVLNGICNVGANTAPSLIGLAAVVSLAFLYGWTIIHD